jgi:hypothetical protein
VIVEEPHHPGGAASDAKHCVSAKVGPAAHPPHDRWFVVGRGEESHAGRTSKDDTAVCSSKPAGSALTDRKRLRPEEQ